MSRRRCLVGRRVRSVRRQILSTHPSTSPIDEERGRNAVTPGSGRARERAYATLGPCAVRAAGAAPGKWAEYRRNAALPELLMLHPAIYARPAPLFRNSKKGDRRRCRMRHPACREVSPRRSMVTFCRGTLAMEQNVDKLIY